MGLGAGCVPLEIHDHPTVFAKTFVSPLHPPQKLLPADAQCLFECTIISKLRIDLSFHFSCEVWVVPYHHSHSDGCVPDFLRHGIRNDMLRESQEIVGHFGRMPIADAPFRRKGSSRLPIHAHSKIRVKLLSTEIERVFEHHLTVTGVPVRTQS